MQSALKSVPASVAPIMKAFQCKVDLDRVTEIPVEGVPPHVLRRARIMNGIIRSANRRYPDSVSMLVLDELGRIFPIDNHEESSSAYVSMAPPSDNDRDFFLFAKGVMASMKARRGKRIDALSLCLGRFRSCHLPVVAQALCMACLDNDIEVAENFCMNLISGSSDSWISGEPGSSERQWRSMTIS